MTCWRIALVLSLTALLSRPAECQPMPPRGPQAPSLASDGPLSAIRTTAHALATKDFKTLAKRMPESWIRSLDNVVQERVRRMDPEVFDRLVAALKDLVNELDRRRSEKTDPQEKMGILSGTEVKSLVGQIITFWRTLEQLGLDRRSGWLTFSTERFAARAAPQLVELLLITVGSEQRSGVEAALKIFEGAVFERIGTRQDEKFGDVIRIRVSMGGEDLEDELVKVEGQWITLNMARSVPEWFREMKAGHDEFSRSQSADRAQRLKDIGEFERAVETYKSTGNIDPVLDILTGEVHHKTP